MIVVEITDLEKAENRNDEAYAKLSKSFILDFINNVLFYYFISNRDCLCFL